MGVGFVFDCVGVRSRVSGRTAICRGRRIVRNLIDPSGRVIPLHPDQKGPAGYIPIEEHPGTFPPGSAGDNYPLESIMDVVDDCEYLQLDIDEVTPVTHEIDVDLLEYLDGLNRLLPRSEEDDVLDEDMQRQMTGITEEDLDYVDNDDEEVLTYFTRTGLDSTMTNPMSSEGYSYEDMY
ncbi:hypothetical protein NDN08_007851 [Rhodosorus marinus]|uniref:Uncharacterized protein n=1 Tax=Rhodosorus marinus TaxID=101924 RepID=A0AAV8UYQ3_9RHOD|nr:hypothetical protein NDN08_007851 [Rhodosorus marinus]